MKSWIKMFILEKVIFTIRMVFFSLTEIVALLIQLIVISSLKLLFLEAIIIEEKSLRSPGVFIVTFTCPSWVLLLMSGCLFHCRKSQQCVLVLAPWREGWVASLPSQYSGNKMCFLFCASSEWRFAVEWLWRETRWPNSAHHGELHGPVPWGQGNPMLLSLLSSKLCTNLSKRPLKIVSLFGFSVS